MPLTPFHWSALILGLVLFDVFYVPALAISSVIMDIEPLYNFFIAPSATGNIHGFFHTYIGAILIALFVGFVLVRTRRWLDVYMKRIRLDQSNVSGSLVYFSSIAAAYSHIFLDSFMHADMQPFWPSVYNPFLGLASVGVIYSSTGFLLVSVVVLYSLRMVRS